MTVSHPQQIDLTWECWYGQLGGGCTTVVTGASMMVRVTIGLQFYRNKLLGRRWSYLSYAELYLSLSLSLPPFLSSTLSLFCFSNIPKQYSIKTISISRPSEYLFSVLVYRNCHFNPDPSADFTVFNHKTPNKWDVWPNYNSAIYWYFLLWDLCVKSDYEWILTW